MYQILKKKTLNANTRLMVIDAPNVARKAEPGQFIILRVSEGSLFAQKRYKRFFGLRLRMTTKTGDNRIAHTHGMHCKR